MKIAISIGAAALCALTFGQANAAAINLIANGNFDSTTFVNNSQFGSNGATGNGGQGVTGWTGGNGYELYFFNGTQTTNSAASQYNGGTYNSGAEKFYALANSPTGGTGNFVALDGDSNVAGSISQTLTNLTLGTNYLVTFSWATGQLQSASGATTEALNVAFGNQNFTTNTVNTPNQGSTPWVQTSFLFKATSAAQTLTFLAQGTPTGAPPMVALDGISLVAAPEPGSLAVLGTGLGLLGLIYRRRQA